MILALRQIRTSVIKCHLVSRDRNLSGSFLYREFCKILKKVKKLHAWKGEFRFRIRKLSSHDRHCVGFVCINDIIELGTGMPVILNPETMGCGFLFAVKILASNVVKQSKRNVLPIKGRKQVLGVSSIEAISRTTNAIACNDRQKKHMFIAENRRLEMGKSIVLFLIVVFKKKLKTEN